LIIILCVIVIVLVANVITFPLTHTVEEQNKPALPLKMLPELREKTAPVQTEIIDKLGGKISNKVDKVGAKRTPGALGWVNAEVLYGISWLKLFACFSILVLVLALERLLRAWIKAKLDQSSTLEVTSQWGVSILEAISRPLSLFLWVYGIYGALSPLFGHFQSATGTNVVHTLARKSADTGGIIALAWLFYRSFLALDAQISKRGFSAGSFAGSLKTSCHKPLKLLVYVVAAEMLLPLVPLAGNLSFILIRMVHSVFIAGLAWLSIQTTAVAEDLIFTYYKVDVSDNIVARRVHTYVGFLKKLIISIAIVVATASILMQFDTVRQVGTGILASAGILGIVVGLAAQRTIANLLVGFQIAITQPIRIDDVVIVENEWGKIEEITSTYVVVRIWDSRRLIVPLTYFAERPFQNWTRISADLLATVNLYADYSLPVAPLRQELSAILDRSPHWDGKVVELQITNATEHTMEIRALVSTADASNAWNLRCEVREKLITFIQKNFPDCLPKLRTEIKQSQTLTETPTVSI
jgi:small-conductance mechanosensitive channel